MGIEGYHYYKVTFVNRESTGDRLRTAVVLTDSKDTAQIRAMVLRGQCVCLDDYHDGIDTQRLTDINVVGVMEDKEVATMVCGFLYKHLMRNTQ